MAMDTTTEDRQTMPEIDEARVEEFAGQLFSIYTNGILSLMVDLAHRTGLLETLAQGPGTSQELAERSGLQERYIRECLGALVTGEIITYSSDTGQYLLPSEHAVCLTGEGSLNLAPLSQVNALLGKHVPAVAEAFREGGGVPYEAFRPEFTEVMDGLSRGAFDGQLVEGMLPLVDGLSPKLAQGLRVADVGCGTGHSTNLLAAAFPASTFVGYDLAADALERGRSEAADMGLTNVSFEQMDIAQLPASPPFDAIFAFDVIHDQVAPAVVLQRIHAALAPGGTFVMADIKAASKLEDNVGNPFAPLLYGISTLHCMTVSLAHDGAGLGTVWGEELAVRMLADAGFADVTVHDVPDDPLNSLYVAGKG